MVLRNGIYSSYSIFLKKSKFPHHLTTNGLWLGGTLISVIMLEDRGEMKMSYLWLKVLKLLIKVLSNFIVIPHVSNPEFGRWGIVLEIIITMNRVKMLPKYQFIILYQGEMYLLVYSLLNTTIYKIVIIHISIISNPS